MDHNEAVSWFFFYLVAWTGLYIFELLFPIPLANKYRKLSLNDELDVRNRFISLIHGTMALILSGYNFFVIGGSCSADNTVFENHLLLISSAYFTYDFIAMAYYGLLDWAMTIHHTVVVFGMCANVYAGTSAHVLLGGMFIAECSNPPMHSRAILKHLGLRFTKAFEVFDLCFIVMYMLARLFLGTYQVWQTFQCNGIYLAVKICALFILLQSYHFSLQMWSILMKRISDIGNRYKQNVTMNWFYPPLSNDDLKALGLDKVKDVTL